MRSVTAANAQAAAQQAQSAADQGVCDRRQAEAQVAAQVAAWTTCT